MPDPARVVRGSAAVLRRLGLSDQSACDVIIAVADRAWMMASEQAPEFRAWLEDIRRIAITRQSSLGKSRTDRGRNDHANG